MGELLVLSAASFALALLLTPIVRNAFLRMRILDSPDGKRKLHQTAVPRIGGIPIAISYVASLAVLPAVHGTGGPWTDDYRLIAGLILAASVVFVTGIVDDLFGLRPWQKLTGQLIAASFVCATGLRITSISGHAVPVWLGIPLTIVWLAVCTNAFNLIDGLDGLASGMGLFATLTMFLAALLHGSDMLALVTLPLAGSLVGFLRYNFNPASVFLGDSGSLLVGFLLGSYALVWSQKSATLVGLTAPLMALAIPLLDVVLSIARRWLRGKPIFDPDRSHIHHKLLERGLTHRGVVLVLYAAAGLCAALSLIQSFAPVRFAGLILVVFCAAAWMGIQNLGYLEFHGARRALTTATLRRTIRAEMAIHTVECRIAAAISVRDCWDAIRETAAQLGFSHVEATLANEFFHEQIGTSNPDTSWQLRVPLGDLGYVQVARDLMNGGESSSLIPFVDMLRSSLLPRLQCMRQTSLLDVPPSTEGLLNLAERLERESAVKGSAVRL